jgi:DNA-binding IclR family transcriptional regulator
VPSTTDDDKGGPIGVLTALAGAGGRLPRRHLATLAGYRPSVSTLRNYLGTLKREGLVEVQGEEVVITDLGRERAGRPPAKTAAELLVMWYRSLTPRSAQVLDAMAHERGPWTEQRIRERCTVPPGASTLRNILTPLRVNDLIRKVRGGLEVNPLLRQHP